MASGAARAADERLEPRFLEGQGEEGRTVHPYRLFLTAGHQPPPYKGVLLAMVIARRPSMVVNTGITSGYKLPENPHEGPRKDRLLTFACKQGF